MKIPFYYLMINFKSTFYLVLLILTLTFLPKKGITCHNSTFNSVTSTTNPNGTTTFTINVTIDVGGSDGYSQGFALIFVGGCPAPTVQAGFTATLPRSGYSTLYGYTGSSIGTVQTFCPYFLQRYGGRTDVLTYETDNTWGYHGSIDYQKTIVVTVSGCVEKIKLDPDFRTLSTNVAGEPQCLKEYSTGNTCSSTAAITGISYSSPLCVGQSGILPTMAASFTSGGTYSASPSLSINASTGSINLTSASANTYTITYSVAATACYSSSSSTTAIVVNAQTIPTTSFSYSSPVCLNGPNPIPTTVAGFSSGGIFSCANSALALNSSSGEINLSATTAGTYTVTYSTTASGCTAAGNSTVSIEIRNTQNAITDFSYSTPICVNSSAQLPNLATGFSSGGTFSSTSGLVINSTTGSIDPSLTTQGTYTVTYTAPNNQCFALSSLTGTTTISVGGSSAAVTGFSFSSPSYCISDINQLPNTVVGFTAGGSYSSSSGNLSVNSGNGEIILTASSAGTYTVTYTVPSSATNCASSHSVTVQVIGLTQPTFGLVSPLCVDSTFVLPTQSNENISGVWNPNTISTTTANYVFAPAGGQCAASATITITPKVYPAFPVFSPICSGASLSLPTSTNGVLGIWTPVVNNLASETYTFTPDANQCAYPKSINIVVNPLPIVNITGNNSICTGETTSLSSTSANTYNWSPSTSLDNTINQTVIATPTISTNYSLSITDANGCSGNITYSVTVKAIPEILNTINDQTVCAGANTSAINFFFGVAGTTVNWTNSSAGIGLPSSGEGNITAFQGSNNGTTPLIAEIIATPTANGCDGLPQTFSITVNPIPVLTSVASQTVCAGQTVNGVTFSSSVSGSTIDWTNTEAGIGLSAIGTGNISSFTGINNGTTPTTATLSAIPTVNGCDGLAQTFSVTVNPNPTDINIVSINETCGLGDASLNIPNATGGVAPYQVSFNSGANAPVPVSLTNLSTGGYTLTVTDANGCVFSKTVTINNNPGPNGILINTLNANCGGSDGQIIVTNTVYSSGQPSNPPYQYSFNGQPFTNNPNLTNIPSGNYTITVNDAKNCTVDSIITIGSNQGLNASFTVTTQLTGNDTLIIGPNNTGYEISYLWNYSAVNDSLNAIYINTSSSGSGISYNWFFNNNESNYSFTTNNSNDLDYNTEGPGPISVTLIATNGNSLCNDTSRILIELKPFIYVPNVFSPNGDGLNEFFSIKYKGYENLNMIIFNRWGNKLFETSNLEMGWNGLGASEGTYFYIITGISNDNKVFDSKGQITLVR